MTDAAQERVEWAWETIETAVADIGSGESPRVAYEDADEALRVLESEVRRLRELEDASGILLDVLEDMKPSGADVPAELDYAMDDLRRALEGSDD